MAYTRAELKEMVKARIDELTPFTDSTTVLNPSLELIEKLMNEATKMVLLTFPKHALPHDDIYTIGQQVTGYDANGRANQAIGYLRINNISAPNWLRFHSFKMWEWERVVFDEIKVESPKYKLQSNVVTMGKPAKPVVALAHNIDGEIALEYYSCDPELQTHNHEIVRAMYIPNMLPENCENTLAEPIAWSTASLVLQVLGEANAMQAALARLESLKNTI